MSMTRVPALDGLPAFGVKRSSRARRVHLRVSARDGLVVTLPPGVSPDRAGEFVRAHRSWVERTLARVADRRALHEAGAEALLPSDVALPFLGILLPVEYVHSSSTPTARWSGHSLVVRGAVDDAEACLTALRRWLARTAREQLTTELLRLAQLSGIRPSKVRIGAQRSRWGSCSSTGTISLNRNLLFLEPELAGSVMLHELAHLSVLDHSPAFWRRACELDPLAREHRRMLKGADGIVPPWADE